MIAALLACVATVPGVEAPIDTGDSTPPLPTFDCSTVPDDLGDAELLDAPRAYKGLAFDAEDRLVGADDNKLYKATSPDEAEVWVPGVGATFQMAWLPDGDLVVVLVNGGLLRVTPEGGTLSLAPDLRTYGVVVGSDGQIYAAGASGVHRVDPDSGETDRLVSWKYEPRSLQFSRDETALYFGTEEYSGTIWRQALDAKLDPVGEPEALATDVGGWHDALEVDACGNIYFIGWWGWKLSRLDADGDVTILREWEEREYGHGLAWGTGVWGDQTLYVSHPYDDSVVTASSVGVPHRSWVGEVLGGDTL